MYSEARRALLHRPRRRVEPEDPDHTGQGEQGGEERGPEPPLSSGAYRKAATVARVSFSTRELLFVAVVPMAWPLYSLVGFDQ